MISNQVEYEFYVSKGKVKKPKSYGCITNLNSVTLRSNEKFDLLFKFCTFREVSHSHLVKSSGDLIKQRNVKIEILAGKKIVESIDCNMMPVFAPIDHVFRYYEPEPSYFKVKIPPFLSLNPDKNKKLSVKISKANA